MLQRLQRKFELYWDPAQDLIINDKTIVFQGVNKDKLQISFKDASVGFQADGFCDCDYMYSFFSQ